MARDYSVSHLPQPGHSPSTPGMDAYALSTDGSKARAHIDLMSTMIGTSMLHWLTAQMALCHMPAYSIHYKARVHLAALCLIKPMHRAKVRYITQAITQPPLQVKKPVSGALPVPEHLAQPWRAVSIESHTLQPATAPETPAACGRPRYVSRQQEALTLANKQPVRIQASKKHLSTLRLCNLRKAGRCDNVVFEYAQLGNSSTTAI